MRQRGVTLIELLVVMAVLALTVSIVVINAPALRPKAEKTAYQFALRLEGLFEDAIISGGAYQIKTVENVLSIERFAEGEWASIIDLSPGAEGIAVQLINDDPSGDNLLALNGERRQTDDRQTVIAPIDPIGDGAPFRVIFRGVEGIWIVSAGADGAVTVSGG